MHILRNISYLYMLRALLLSNIKRVSYQLCATAAAAGESCAPVRAINKMEGGFSRALVIEKEDASEVIVKIPFPIAGPPKYTTASESADATNPVGAEYIIMEKAPGTQLFNKWGDMSDLEQFRFVKEVGKVEGKTAGIRFPATGSLYLRKSTVGDSWVPLDPKFDPSGQFCIGPSCDRGWYKNGDQLVVPEHRPGPWTSIASFGVALIDREAERLGKGFTPASLSPRDSLPEQHAALQMTREVMLRLESDTEPTKIVSLIDWQSIGILPAFLQARFPEFLSVDKDFSIGSDMPSLPSAYNQMNTRDKNIEDHKLQQRKLAKTYELSTKAYNNSGYKGLIVPDYLRELFIRCSEVHDEGDIPLRACLIEISKDWSELGFSGDCPFSFSDADVQRHEDQFQKYRDFHQVQELARELLDTDSEGWTNPRMDFAEKQQQNNDLLLLIMSRSSEYNMSPEEIRRIWPFIETA
ncbi:hypothetical protein DM02DRAFT_721750 [Periconia macrospinosa]|uniref:Aminoglycoside phosphotransferase domain-containing protein n=1 Tax=Periconia macrospinosa TaxID=97972 RepID=A0A2V1D856_9PLEO|nr:hypothetical protein DM02DRAFT_721750 [Periconia macrospinosa]